MHILPLENFGCMVNIYTYLSLPTKMKLKTSFPFFFYYFWAPFFTLFSFVFMVITYIGTCTSKDISISQSQTSTPGIPQFIVQIVNNCVSGCAPSDIHLHCGMFASARMVNPRLFKRISYDDCLVNGGNPLAPSQIIRFTYSNTFSYPLAFKSAKFCWVFQNIQIFKSRIKKLAQPY